MAQTTNGDDGLHTSGIEPRRAVVTSRTLHLTTTKMARRREDGTREVPSSADHAKDGNAQYLAPLTDVVSCRRVDAGGKPVADARPAEDDTAGCCIHPGAKVSISGRHARWRCTRAETIAVTWSDRRSCLSCIFSPEFTMKRLLCRHEVRESTDCLVSHILGTSSKAPVLLSVSGRMYPILNVHAAHEDLCLTASQHATSQHQQEALISGIQAARGAGEDAAAEAGFITCLEPIGTASRVLGLETLRAHRQVHNGSNQMLGLERSEKATVYTIIVVIMITGHSLTDVYISVTGNISGLPYAISYAVLVTQAFLVCLAGLIDLDNFSLSLISFIWVVMYISQTVVIVCASSAAVRSARKTVYIVQNLLLKQGIDDEAPVELTSSLTMIRLVIWREIRLFPTRSCVDSHGNGMKLESRYTEPTTSAYRHAQTEEEHCTIARAGDGHLYAKALLGDVKGAASTVERNVEGARVFEAELVARSGHQTALDRATYAPSEVRLQTAPTPPRRVIGPGSAPNTDGARMDNACSSLPELGAVNITLAGPRCCISRGVAFHGRSKVEICKSPTAESNSWNWTRIDLQLESNPEGSPQLACPPRVELGRLSIAGWSAWAVSLLASHQVETGSVADRLLPDFRMWESCRTMALKDGTSSCGDVVVRLFASHQGEPTSVPSEIAPGLPHVTIAPDDADDQRRFDYAPLTWTKRVRLRAWSLPDFRTWESCRAMSLVGVFSSGTSRFPRPCIMALPYPALASPSSPQYHDVKRRTNLSTPTSDMGRGGLVVRLLASHQGEPSSVSSEVAPGLSYVRIEPNDANDQRVYSGISRLPRPCIPALLYPHLASHPSALKTTILIAN
ncbi:hypothetical protein PR048_006581 [Dryococelus australis]|uniref:Uncharacterized protein n=1 Tax=Dryococelus australis TaxID=614101 RepID=A0ABQ9ICP1_9NEOP|nr:hypothetical protein PR048_006581 [Dryococelus australis]